MKSAFWKVALQYIILSLSVGLFRLKFMYNIIFIMNIRAENENDA